MPEREDEGHTDSVTRLNLRTIGAPQRFVISSDSSHHSGANISEVEVDSFAMPSVLVITAATIVTSTADLVVTDPAMGGFTDLTSSDFLVGGIHTVINPDSDLQKVYVPQWNVTNGSRLDDGGVCRGMVDEFAPPKFFASVRGMEHDQLFTKFNVGTARQMSLSAEAKDEEIGSLKAQLLLKEAEAAKAISLRAAASKFEAVEKSLQGEVEVLKERNTTLDKEKNELDVKVVDLPASVKVREQEVADLDAVVASVKSQNDNLVNQVHELETDFIEMALHLEKRFYPHLLTTIAGSRWLLTYGMELAVTKCLNSPEYLFALGAAISKSIEKGMQDGLAAKITHGKEGRVLADVAAYNPSVEVDYGTRGNSDTVHATADTTTALSITLASASTIIPISVDDYEVAGTDDQAAANENVADENLSGGDVNPFPNVDDAELNVPE
ncbi:hypothetical protein Tco_1413957 [Tanacetum coccineum]